MQMNINTMMTNGIVTMNNKHMLSENELNRLQNHAIMDQMIVIRIESLLKNM